MWLQWLNGFTNEALESDSGEEIVVDKYEEKSKLGRIFSDTEGF